MPSTEPPTDQPQNDPANDVAGVVDVGTACQSDAPAGTALFELRNVNKRFGRQRVLEDINLRIEPGKTTVIIGPSGCGKTVLLKHLIALLRPDSGEVFFDGQRIDHLRERELIPVRRRCGYLFQAGALFDSETVAQNVAFPLWQHTSYTAQQINDIVQEKLQHVDLERLAARMPAELSGGQQKRVALARAIALSPEAILYDEPTTGLDPIRSGSISGLILKLQNQLQITSVVVTHDMTSAYKIADRIIMLSRGRIVADGSPDEIRNSGNAVVQRFVRGQPDLIDDDLSTPAS